jgi:hypothetical protein
MQFREDIVRGVRLAGFGFAALLVFLALHRTVNFVGNANAKEPAVNTPEPDPNAFLAMPAPVVPPPPATEPAPPPAPGRPPAHTVVQKEQTVPAPPPPKRKGSTEFAAKYVPPARAEVAPETNAAPAFAEPPPQHISAESLAAVAEPAPPPGKPTTEDAAKLPPITPVFVVPPESKQNRGVGWIKAVGRALRPKKDD